MKNLLLITLLLSLCACGGTERVQSDRVSSRFMLSDNSDFYGRAVSQREEKNLLAQKIYYFAFDSYRVQTDDLLSLYAHANKLFQNSKYHLRIEGHTDERGSHGYNNALGERRAESIAAVLLLKGVPATQFSIVSFGKEKPTDYGHSEQAWKLNRRVELVYEVD